MHKWQLILRTQTKQIRRCIGFEPNDTVQFPASCQMPAVPTTAAQRWCSPPTRGHGVVAHVAAMVSSLPASVLLKSQLLSAKGKRKKGGPRHSAKGSGRARIPFSFQALRNGVCALSSCGRTLCPPAPSDAEWRLGRSATSRDAKRGKRVSFFRERSPETCRSADY